MGSAGQNTPAVVPPAAEVFDLKAPEGVDPKDSLLAEFVPVAKEAGLKVEAAQKLVDWYGQQNKARAALAEKQQAEAFEQRQKQWQESARSDKDFGGQQFDASLQSARKALLKFGDPELMKAFDELGVGDHPAFIRAWARVGKALGEDSVSGAMSPGVATPATSDDALYRAMYPNSPDLFSKES